MTEPEETDVAPTGVQRRRIWAADLKRRISLKVARRALRRRRLLAAMPPSVATERAQADRPGS